MTKIVIYNEPTDDKYPTQTLNNVTAFQTKPKKHPIALIGKPYR